MSGEVQQHIQKFLYNLSNGDYASADKELKTIIDQKYQEQYDAAYEALKESTEQPTDINKLVNWINSHDGVRAKFTGGKLYVQGEVSKNGVVSKETTVIPPTLKAARDWLGY